MNKTMKAQIRDSFDRLQCSVEDLTLSFYDVLFDLAPETRPMFPEDIKPQSIKLMRTLAHVMEGLDNLPGLTKPLKELGALHLDYGVEDEHYSIVTAALLRTLSMNIESWSPADHSAWAKLINIICSKMIEGAREARADSSAA